MKLETRAANNVVVRTRAFPSGTPYRTYVITPTDSGDGNQSVFVAGSDREDRAELQHQDWVRRVNADAEAEAEYEDEVKP